MLNLINKILFHLINLIKSGEDYHSNRINKELCISDKSVRFYRTAKINLLNEDNSSIIIESNCHIRGELLIFRSGGIIKIGSNCFIGENSHIWSADRIIIGNNVLISHNVNIIDTNSHEIDHIERAQSYLNLVSKGHSKDKGSILTTPIVIEDHAWINFNAVILKGVTIGKGAIVAAGSVVTKDVQPFTLVAGNPAKFVKRINEKSNK